MEQDHSKLFFTIEDDLSIQFLGPGPIGISNLRCCSQPLASQFNQTSLEYLHAFHVDKVLQHAPNPMKNYHIHPPNKKIHTYICIYTSEYPEQYWCHLMNGAMFGDMKGARHEAPRPTFPSSRCPAFSEERRGLQPYCFPNFTDPKIRASINGEPKVDPYIP